MSIRGLTVVAALFVLRGSAIASEEAAAPFAIQYPWMTTAAEVHRHVQTDQLGLPSIVPARDASEEPARLTDFDKPRNTLRTAFSPQETVVRAQSQDGGGGGNLSSAATNPTSDLTIVQFQNTFTPSTYGATGYANTYSTQIVFPIKTGLEFFPTWITRTTVPVISTADPDGMIALIPDIDPGFFDVDLDRTSGLGDSVIISIFNHPTDWGSWGIGPGFVLPTATEPELGQRSWMFAPTFAIINTQIENLQLGIIGFYQFPLDSRGTQVFQFQPLIVYQLGKGWYTGYGDDLWTFNTESGRFSMPLQLRVGRVCEICTQPVNIALTGIYTPGDFHDGPAPEWGVKFSFSFLFQ